MDSANKGDRESVLRKEIFDSLRPHLSSNEIQSFDSNSPTFFEQLKATLLFSPNSKTILEETFWSIFGPLVDIYDQQNNNNNNDNDNNQPNPFLRDTLFSISQEYNPKEAILVVTMKMGGVENTIKPTTFVLLLEILQNVLSKIKSKRSNFIKTSLPTLTKLISKLVYVDVKTQTQSGQNEKEQEEEDEEESKLPRSSFKIDFIGGADTDDDSPDTIIQKQNTAIVLPALINFLVGLATCVRNEDSDSILQRQFIGGFVFDILSTPLLLNETNHENLKNIVEVVMFSRINVLELFNYLPSIKEGSGGSTKTQKNETSTEDNDSEEDSDQEEDTPLKSWSLPGVGYLFYLLLVKNVSPNYIPSIYSPQFLLNSILPYATSLLKSPFETKSPKSIKIVNTLIKPLPKSVILDKTIDHRSQLIGDSDYLDWCRTLIDFIVRCPVDKVRTLGYRSLNSFLWAFSAETRFSILYILLKTSPYPAVTGLLIHRLKEEINIAWNDDSSDNSRAFFASQKLIEILPIFMTCGDILERADVLMNALNLYRFLLIKDKAYNQTSIWSKGQIAMMRERFLTPLSNSVKQMLNRFSDEQIHPQTKKIQRVATDEKVAGFMQDLKKMDMVEMTEENVKHASSMNIMSLQMIEEIILRVEELINTVED